MVPLKPLSPEALPAALARAERYRLLNEPGEAESICHDVLLADADNQAALVTLLLALTDQFDRNFATKAVEAHETLARLSGEYERAYYAGIVCERKAKAWMRRAAPCSGIDAYEWFRQAMAWFEKAEELRPPGNDEALLRWNACARHLMRNPALRPRDEEASEPITSE